MLNLQTIANGLTRENLKSPYRDCKLKRIIKKSLHDYSILSYFHTLYLLPYSYTVDLLPTSIKNKSTELDTFLVLLSICFSSCYSY